MIRAAAAPSARTWCFFIPVRDELKHRARILLVVFAAALPLAACGSGTHTPVDPPAPPTPAPSPGPVVNMVGKWTGTLESSNFPTRTIDLEVIQSADCVDGSWTSTPAGWQGAISGYAGASSYSGLMSFERPGDEGDCSGVGNVSGPVDDKSITWTGTGFTGNCPAGMPQSITVKLRRK